VEKILVDLMTEKVMYVGVQTSLTSRLKASPSTGRHFGRGAEKRSKNCDDLDNVKQIPLVFPDYILPLTSMVNRDNVPCDFEYMLFIVYLPKGIRAVGP
jgi:hypothetical protein